mmetsp:Transcript_7583/g.21578  ORF Transcript_7583/g.21578 Transcript_7583/m.21578 type:complete len:165 (+) Transcript_7583:841-1335(+)
MVSTYPLLVSWVLDASKGELDAFKMRLWRRSTMHLVFWAANQADEGDRTLCREVFTHIHNHFQKRRSGALPGWLDRFGYRRITPERFLWCLQWTLTGASPQLLQQALLGLHQEATPLFSFLPALWTQTSNHWYRQEASVSAFRSFRQWWAMSSAAATKQLRADS